MYLRFLEPNSLHPPSNQRHQSESEEQF